VATTRGGWLGASAKQDRDSGVQGGDLTIHGSDLVFMCKEEKRFGG